MPSYHCRKHPSKDFCMAVAYYNEEHRDLHPLDCPPCPRCFFQSMQHNNAPKKWSGKLGGHNSLHAPHIKQCMHKLN